MAGPSERELAEGIAKEIEYPLAALVSRLRRRATQNISTEYIDEARQKFQDALAHGIAAAIIKASTKGIQ